MKEDCSLEKKRLYLFKSRLYKKGTAQSGTQPIYFSLRTMFGQNNNCLPSKHPKNSKLERQSLNHTRKTRITQAQENKPSPDSKAIVLKQLKRN